MVVYVEWNDIQGLSIVEVLEFCVGGEMHGKFWFSKYDDGQGN